MAKKLNKATPLIEIEHFIKQFTQPNLNKYQDAEWLLSDYKDSIWKISCFKSFSINWSIHLGNGELLTLPKHEKLLNTLKSWLIVQTHTDLTNGHTYSPRTLNTRLTRVLYCIDYFLLRSNILNLHNNGFDALTKNNVRELVSKIGQGFLLSEGVYEFQLKLVNFLKSQIENSSIDELETIINDNPWLCCDLNDLHNRNTNLSEREINLARAWLWINDLYDQSEKYKYDLHISELTQYLYADTLLGSRINFIVPNELKLGFWNEYETEYPCVRVISDFDRRMSRKEHTRMVTTILSLNLVLRLDKSNNGFDEADIIGFQSALDLKMPGRFKTLPHSVYIQALCAAIEYVLTNGDFIIDSYLNLSDEFVKSNMNTNTFLSETDIRKYLNYESIKFGINRWKVDTKGDLLRKTKLKNNTNYYDSLRLNVGLYECLRVLYGAIQIIIGSLSAQRSGSLIELVAGKCLDTSKTRLVFFNKKSGHSGLNNKISRPIPSIAVRCIEMIERLQSGLIKFGLLSEPTYLFAYPQINTLIPSSSLVFSKYVDSFDFFCDWAELPLNSEGQRYYIRNHQLRRHFAMLFFWGNGYGGMDPLRWFLGHTDVEHLWHYITEITPGYTLRSIAAEWGTYAVIHGSPEAQVLNTELTNHFGTSEFSVLESDVLQSYLEELMENNKLVIEPQFISGGKDYKIGFILKSI